ncbi:Rpn family recombination-promoting nuclease/putative transposase [Wolbachia endosymbiont of Folsomia candida]|uniref:Rpn family recombination-promoting nuclease/putative transposase n=1 Tax=Wolbachia endosymbiont of Folsomia candida TaxID=169402 RepID=UPI000A97FF54|nr:Rpn family recombination-promoting nuclease/putative transposase [Wolbachia endosymbiont of Folsomia candida]APR97849.1 transposase [Wolbachia endosymbiont of Folsomia candida]
MVLSKLLNPKNDLSFKKVFGSEKNKDILVHFLNDVLNLTGESQIIKVIFSQTVQNPEIISKKQSIVDILCTDFLGIQYIVELQVTKYPGFEKRAQYYAAHAYCDQAHVGDQYHDLKEVIFIAIVDYIIFPDKPEYKSDHAILDRKSYEHDLKDFHFTFIELPKSNKTKEDELDDAVSKWCWFFRYATEIEEEDREKVFEKYPIIKKACDALNQYYWSDQELMEYNHEAKRLRDESVVLQHEVQSAKTEGIQIGEERGKIEVAKSMLADNMDINTIAKFTGLSADEIKKLQKENTH